jgi:hypothetical protein
LVSFADWVTKPLSPRILVVDKYTHDEDANEDDKVDEEA